LVILLFNENIYHDKVIQLRSVALCAISVALCERIVYTEIHREKSKLFNYNGINLESKVNSSASTRRMLLKSGCKVFRM
jgi:hypothetical protein